jgi:hypothetical protein
MKTFEPVDTLRAVMINLTWRALLMPPCVAALLAISPPAQAQPRVMEDDEMDQVCAKGSDGYEVSAVAVHQMVFDFHQQTSVGQVNCTGVIVTEIIPNVSGNTQITVGPARSAAGSSQSATRTTLTTVVSPSATAIGAGFEISPTDIQIANGTVRIRGDINIDVQALPGSLRALEQNRLIMPAGFNLTASPAPRRR